MAHVDTHPLPVGEEYYGLNLEKMRGACLNETSEWRDTEDCS